MSGAPLLMHIHVPKCGGTSIRRALDEILGPGHLPLYFEHTTFALDDSDLAEFVRPESIKALSSHSVRRFPRELGGRRMHYVTLLRDPVEQFISYITFTKKHYAAIRDPILLKHLPPEMPSLSVRECARWILNGGRDVFVNFRDNYTTNFFARHVALDARAYKYSDHRYKRRRLKLAQQVLDRFLFVGIVEQMEESWQLLRMRAGEIGIDLSDGAVSCENPSADLRDDLSWMHAGDEVGKKLLESLAEDRELYRGALQKFERQVSKAHNT